MAKKKVNEEAVATEVVETIQPANDTKKIIIERKEEETPEQLQEELSIAQKLLSLYYLQQVCSKIDKILVERGELPNEVRDLEDALEGLKTRIAKYQVDIKEIVHVARRRVVIDVEPRRVVFHTHTKAEGLGQHGVVLIEENR